jgi:predicted transposase/invertase (TIGR01784 family)
MKFVDPKVDSAFKLLFGVPSNKTLVKDFLNSVLSLSQGSLIQDIEFISSEIVSPVKEFGDNKVFIDIHCLDQRNHNYIIEMQVENQHNFVPRIMYYTSRALWLQKVKKGDYQSLLPVIGIGIVNYKLFNNQENISGNPVSKYVFKHETDNTVLPDSILDFYFVELPKFRKNLDELATQLDRWLYFLKYADDLTFIPDQLKSLEPAFHVLNEVTWGVQELAQYRQEEEQIGARQRIEEGARKEGIQEGIEESSKQIACNLLQSGMSIEFVAKNTGLSYDQIEKLCRK